jgi:ankyrin repeat protein
LHYAVQDRDLHSIVALLIHAGADRSSRDAEGMTPLEHATKLRRRWCIKKLLTAFNELPDRARPSRRKPVFDEFSRGDR